jgi:hypothetical protein
MAYLAYLIVGFGFAVLVGGTAPDVGVAMSVSVLDAALMWPWLDELPTMRAAGEMNCQRARYEVRRNECAAVVVRAPGVEVIPVLFHHRIGSEGC